MELKLSLEEVTELVRGERIYQDSRWPGHTHTAQEYMVYISDYLHEAMHLVSRNDEHDTAITSQVLGIVRKIAAMCVAFRQECNELAAYQARSPGRILLGQMVRLLGRRPLGPARLASGHARRRVRRLRVFGHHPGAAQAAGGMTNNNT